MKKKSIAISELSLISKNALIKAGLSLGETEVVIRHLTEEELLGKDTHGFFRLPKIIKCLQENSVTKEITYDKISSNFFCINGGNHLGLVVAQEACNSSIKKTTEHQFTIVCAKNYIGTTGAMGYYSAQLAKAGLISIIICNSEYAVAPWGGKDPILGTNPISFGFPSDPDPIIIDFATSSKTYGELMLAVASGVKIKEGIVLDKDGNPSNDPNDANNGCQLPMAEHKGFGLGLAIEILSGVFIGAKAGKDAVGGSDGFVIIGLRPDIFVDGIAFQNNLSLLIKEIKESSIAPGFNEIRIPGEGASNRKSLKLEKGILEINSKVYDEILQLS